MIVKKWFSLLELLVVIAIIAILAAILLPTLNKMKQTANRIYCLNNIKSYTLLWQAYTSSSNDWMIKSDTVWFDKILQEAGNTAKQTSFYCCPISHQSRYRKSEKVFQSYDLKSYGYNQYVGNGYKITMVKRPSMVFLFGDSDDDAYFGCYINAWDYLLGNRHDGTGCVGYIDGHVSVVVSRLWHTPLTVYGTMNSDAEDGKPNIKSARSTIGVTKEQYYAWGYVYSSVDYLTK